ncbi:exodeoxyribonuclease V subunit gamma [Chlorobium sp. N1]|uniref:exodeoxyribonuclease V subunit gamma n=1 Tax=Chlorobium sp. N1 TaxID=2491138 RepID=UPI001038B91D|nr:exodeoxyribonuclease V subunit gamma [Chlorobium sp. N1]TCD48342.1 exodeoxyribonuclease V subunit gamma [Chlorobium sp. N1]
MAINIHASNRTEELAGMLASLIDATPLYSPFQEEVIVVQSRGMQRWLSIELARRLGVWAGARYPFPNAVVSELFASAFHTDEGERLRYDPELMAWSIMRLLPPLLAEGEFAVLGRYLSGGSAPLRLFQLATKIADTFDQYTLFRPAMLAEWEAGGGPDGTDAWQPILWRTITAALGGRHRGQLKEEFLRAGSLSGSVFPGRISLFGISYLPQFHLDVLGVLARHREVNLFLLSPTREYWGDIVSRRTLSRMKDAERMLRTEGNPLLASLGRIGRDFSEMVLDIPDEEGGGSERYVDPGAGSLLHAVQSDILNLTGTGEEGRRPFPEGDRSLQVHACHSAQREVEVLHDRLLDMLESIEGLAPRDIVVMAPDIETYSPFVSAVFGISGERHIPFSVADRRLMNEGEVASAFLRLLALQHARTGAPELFDLLSSPPVAFRFGLDGDALSVIRAWIVDTRIRWGIDEKERLENQLPPFRQNSWRAGLDRLLLGYAMEGEDPALGAIVPFGDFDGGSAETLGIFADFIDAVELFRRGLSTSRTLGEWRGFLAGMLERFIRVDEKRERELLAVQGVLDRLGEIGRDSLYRDAVPPEVVLSWLKGRLEQQEQGLGFMTGGVTFCSMLPMRSVPFRVVVLLGMGDGAFPRQHHAPGFDLIARSPRRGDRSLRVEDRYLFLETLLSARDVLYVSYVGQSVRDNSPIPPSVLVSELLDAVERGFILPEGKRAEDILTLRHRLQPFSPDCFSAYGPLFSYSEENFLAGEEPAGAFPAGAFMEEPLAEPPESMRRVELRDLLRFFDNPSAFFLRERLGLQGAMRMQPLEEREPFEIDGLEAYRIRAALAGAMLEGEEHEPFLSRFRAEGVLPPSTSGERLYMALSEEASGFVDTVRRLVPPGRPLPAEDVSLQCGPFTLSGRLEGLQSACQLFTRPASMKSKERMRSWISHLVLSIVADGSLPSETLLIMKNGAYRLRRPDDPEALLLGLLEGYWQGLRTPLPYFPETSFAWEGKRDKGEAEALKEARSAWLSSRFTGAGEGDDPAVMRCFGPSFLDPAAAGFDTFRRLAEILVRPVLDHSEAMK